MLGRRAKGLASQGALLIWLAALAAAEPAGAAAEEPSPLEVPAAVLALEQAVINAVERCERSVVAITRQRRREAVTGSTFQPFAPLPRPALPIVPQGTSGPGAIAGEFGEFGTGVIVDARGLVLTNYHVLEPDVEGFVYFITTAGGNEYRAELIAADPRSDLAVLEAQDAGAGQFEAMPLGRAESLRKGQLVVALGNPYAIARDGSASASWGIVTNLGRKFGADTSRGSEQTQTTLYHLGAVIQTDARLNLGTSGGALITLAGEMVGLTTSLAALAGYEQAAGYAIPVDDMFRRILATLKEGREVEYGFLGIHLQTLTRQERALGKQGVLVGAVYPATPAMRAGLRPGDRITALNDLAVSDSDGLILGLGRYGAEALVRLTVIRNGDVIQKEVELAKNGFRGKKVFREKGPAWRGLRIDYLTSDSKFAERVQLEIDFAQGGVIVSEVEQGSPAAQEGLRPGMLITHVGGVRVLTPRDFQTAVSGQSGAVELQLGGEPGRETKLTIRPESG